MPIFTNRLRAAALAAAIFFGIAPADAQIFSPSVSMQGGGGIPQPVVNGECVIGSGGKAVWGSCSGSGTTVTSVSGTSGQIVASPTIGDVVLSLAPTITANLTFNGNITLGTGVLLSPASGIHIQGSSTGFTQLQSALTGSSNNTMIFPPEASDTLVDLTGTQTLINKTLTSPTIAGGTLSGTFSGNFTASGVPILSGLSTGTQVSCLGLDSGNHIVLNSAACGAGGGTVTSVGFSVPSSSIFGVTGSPITTSGVLGLTTTGTSGGIPYFSSGTQLSSTAALGANLPVFGGGPLGTPFTGTVSGNTTKVVTISGSTTSNDCAKWDASGNLIDAGVTCGGSGTPVVFVASTSTNSGNAYTVATTTPSGFTLTNGFLVHVGSINATNTGASTANVGSAGAVHIMVNTVTGLQELTGGELGAGLPAAFSVNTACPGSITCLVLENSPGSVAQTAATGPVHAPAWAAFTAYDVPTAGVTLTLDVSTLLSPNGGIVIRADKAALTLCSTSPDVINGGSAGGCVLVPKGSVGIAGSDGAGNIYAAGIGGSDRVVSGTTDTLTLSDCGNTVVYTSNSAVTVTTFSSAVTGVQVCPIALKQSGTGQVSIADGAGATHSSPHSFTKTFAQDAILGVTVFSDSPSKWIISGDGA